MEKINITTHSYALQNYKKSLESLHHFSGKADQSRFEKLIRFVYVVIKKGESSLQKIGEGLEEEIDVESRVKKVKRFLKSKYTDYQCFFMPLIGSFMSGLPLTSRLFLSIDGSVVGKDCMALMVSVVHGKRAIPLAWLVRRQKKGHMSVEAHLEVLALVRELLPSGVKEVILLGDGEFDSVDLQMFATAQGWKYVLRTAKNALIETWEKESFHLGDCYPNEEEDSFWIEEAYLSERKYGPVNCLVCHQRIFEHPIYLVSSLESAIEAQKAYQKRFSIETIFGDLKSRGFNLQKVRVKDPDMLSNLLIIVALAFLMVFTLGLHQNQVKMSRIVRKDRTCHYSIFQIGYKIARYIAENQIDIFYKLKHFFITQFCVRF